MMIKRDNKLYVILLAVILITASVPVFCMYIMEGGMAEQWAALLQNFMPGVSTRRLWVILLFLIQLGSLGGAVLLYRYVCPGRTGSLCGVLLYMTMPFRLYLCYDRADLAQAVVWMLLPWYLWSILHVLDGRKCRLFVPLSVLFLAAAGYANAVLFLIAAGLTLLAGLIWRKPFLFVTVLGGFILGLPWLKRFLEFLTAADFGTLPLFYDISFESIMPKGYAPGELLGFFSYAEDKPGIGAGLLLVLFLLVWSSFVENRSLLQKREMAFLVTGGLLLLLSLRYFPWDLVQRVHPVLLKTVALFRTPGCFLHFACFLFTVPCAGAMGRLYREGDKYRRVFLTALLFTVCIAMAFYQGNTYIFSRLPLQQ